MASTTTSNREQFEQTAEDLNPGALSKAELDEFERVNAQTIADLENDLRLLKRKISQFGPGALPDTQLHRTERSDGSSNQDEIDSRLDKELEEQTARLDETMRLTGVTIGNIHREVLHIDNTHCKKRFSLELLVLNRRVHLTYILDEALAPQDEDAQGGKISWFEIKFEEDINEAIGDDIAKAADELAIHSVFSLLKTYLQCQETQTRALKELRETYPNNVSHYINKEGIQCSEITNPKPNHPVFTIEWRSKTFNARVEPDVKLLVKAPSELSAMDRNHVLDSAPEMFRTMITTLGLEQAVHSLVQLIATDGQVLQQSQQS